MVKCCSCSNNGVCKNCVCVTKGTPCRNCNPGRLQRCHNFALTGGAPVRGATAAPAAGKTTASLSPCSIALSPSISLSSSSPSSSLSLFSQALPLLRTRDPVSRRCKTARADNHSGDNVLSSNEEPGGRVTFAHDKAIAGAAAVGECQQANRSANPAVEAKNAAPAGADGSASASGDAHIDPQTTEPQNPECEFTWGEVDGKSFAIELAAAYTEVVQWRRNVFMVPSGSAGKRFVREICRLIDSFTQRSTLEATAVCAVMTMPHLLLQKSHAKSKSKENVENLERRLLAWEKGDIKGLLLEGRAIQNNMVPKSARQNDEDTLSRSFGNLVHQGRIRSALRLLDDSHVRGGVLPLDSVVPNSGGKLVRQVLKEKHPTAKDAQPETLVTDPGMSTANTSSSPMHHPVIFQEITAESIRSAALRVEGAAGPSGIDACGWRRLCTSFGVVSDNLCRSLADFTKRICSETVTDSFLAAYVACRLIPLDKGPGVRPIGVCEVMRRIVGKAALQVIGKSVQRAAGTAQLCAGQPMGIEAAIHATRSIFDDDSCEAILMVDATNAFNCLNRKAALHNTEQLCPALATLLYNTYGRAADLFVDGEVLKSEEGVTQGDPLAMAMYAVGTVPLIRDLAKHVQSKQVWYADDASDGGKLENIKLWWDRLSANGPAYGYFPNAAKTWLLVKSPFRQKAQELFESTGINITTEGRRLLGGAIGEASFVTDYINRRVMSCTRRVEILGEIAKSQPQAAYTAFTKGLKGEWTFLSRTTGNTGPLLEPVEAVIRTNFIPAITGRTAPGDAERDLLALPARHGGLGLSNPTSFTAEAYEGSRRAAEPLSKLIEEQCTDLGNTCDEVKKRRTKERAKRNKQTAEKARTVLPRLDADVRRAAEQAAEKGASSWLTVLPLDRYGFALHKADFRDALCLRYSWPPALLPTTCVCGQPFNSSHALSCPTGGYPSLRHNELRDITARLMQEVSYDVSTEPVLQPVTGEPLTGRCTNRDDNARLDIAARGFWGCGAQKAFFDVRVFNPSAPSHRTIQIGSLYQRQEREKRRQYQERVCQIERGSFTPLVFATSGGMGPAATVAYKRLASMLATKRKASYAQTMAWIRAMLSFALLRSAIMCLRGSRRARTSLPSLLPPVDLVISESRLQT